MNKIILEIKSLIFQGRMGQGFEYLYRKPQRESVVTTRNEIN